MHLYGPKPYIDKIKGICGLQNRIWTCIGPTSRLNLKKLLDNNVLFIVCESLIWKFSCLHAFMRIRVFI